MSALFAVVLLAVAGGQDAKPRKIVLVAAGDHGKDVVLLKHCLLTSPSLKGLHVDLHLDGGPAAFDGADAILLTSPASGDRLAAIEKQLLRGCGLVLLHAAAGTAAPPCERQYSPGAPGHPIVRGVRPFAISDEARSAPAFGEGAPVLLCGTDVAGRAVERKEGGRGFAFSGGRFSAAWGNPDFRRLILNAVAWTAKIEVPAGGVESPLDDPIRVLILTGHHYPAHEWKATTPPLVAALEQDPRVRVGVTEDVDDLANGKLDAQDVLVLNYMNWGRPGLSDKQKRGLLDFLGRGGGFVAFHGATGTWNGTLCPKESDWPEFRTKILCRWWDHPKSGHDNFGPFRVEIAAPDHEITRGLPAFDTTDELYIDLAGTDGLALVTAASKVAARNEPLAWAHGYGKARVFVTALGHGPASIRSAGALFRRGTVWAANRPPLAFDPPSRRTP